MISPGWSEAPVLPGPVLRAATAGPQPSRQLGVHHENSALGSTLELCTSQINMLESEVNLYNFRIEVEIAFKFTLISSWNKC